MSLIQGDILEVLQLPQIPQLDHRIIGSRSQVVTILGEGEGSDRSGMSREGRHIGALFQIPNFDDAVSGSGSKNETIRVELCAGQSWWKEKK